jgi:predicted  nucleic acid-binding Zn-ribbon protein
LKTHQEDKMTEEIKAYCMKCKAERTIQNVQIAMTKNGRPAANGACPVCGTKMFKFLPSSYKESAAPYVAAPAAVAEAAPAAAPEAVAPASEPVAEVVATEAAPAEPAPEANVQA